VSQTGSGIFLGFRRYLLVPAVPEELRPPLRTAAGTFEQGSGEKEPGLIRRYRFHGPAGLRGSRGFFPSITTGRCGCIPAGLPNNSPLPKIGIMFYCFGFIEH